MYNRDRDGKKDTDAPHLKIHSPEAGLFNSSDLSRAFQEKKNLVQDDGVDPQVAGRVRKYQRIVQDRHSPGLIVHGIGHAAGRIKGLIQVALVHRNGVTHVDKVQ
mmetsp:Transcript_3896/g.4516  ORF Transcript_3896/g.4516 Transcript_3896/m.4516 type:complete len:105 (-) Transcript_3896:967-1281(-)